MLIADPLLVAVTGALSLVSGFASYLQGRRDGRLKKSALDLSAELSMALVGGLGVLFFGAWKELPPPAICLGVLLVASSGGILWTAAQSRLKTYITPKSGDQE